MTIQHIVEGAGAPVAAPPSRGAHYINTTNGDQYLATGTLDVSDWLLQERGGAAAAAMQAHEQAADPHTGYVQKVAGKGLSTEDYTSAEKAKLAGLEGSHFKGVFVDLAALTAGVAAPVAGDYADVDAGAGTDVARYIWDATDAAWKVQGAATTLTAAEVKTLLESNADTNTVTDAEKAALAGIGGGPVDPVVAVANSASPYLRLMTLSNMYTLPAVTSLPGPYTGPLNFSPDGKLLAVGSNGSPSLTIYNTDDWSMVPRPATMPTVGVEGVKFTADGRYLIVISNSSPYLKIYNVSDWTTRTLYNAPTARPDAIAVSAFGSLAMGLMSSPYLQMRRTSDGDLSGTIDVTPTSMVSALAFSPDGNRLIAGRLSPNNPRLMVYDTTSSAVKKMIDPRQQPDGDIRALVFSKDGKRLFVGTSVEPYLHVYDVETWEKLPGPAREPSSQVTGMALSKDGRYLLVSIYNGTARTYDTDTMAFVRDAYGGSSEVSGVAVQPFAYATDKYLDEMTTRLGSAILRTQRATLDVERSLALIAAMQEATGTATTYASDFDVDLSQFTGTWALTTTWAASGNTQSLGSTNTTDNSSSTATLTQTLAKPSWLKLDWHTDSEEIYDALIVKVNGVEAGRMSGLNQSGTFGPYEVPAGSFTLEVTYTKDSMGLGGTDRVYIDNVKIISQP